MLKGGLIDFMPLYVSFQSRIVTNTLPTESVSLSASDPEDIYLFIYLFI